MEGVSSSLRYSVNGSGGHHLVHADVDDDVYSITYKVYKGSSSSKTVKVLYKE